MHTDVIVVGAGMSGIAAAQTLQAAGVSVKVLEARERIGGRTYTDSSLGVDIDLGAAWIHGPDGNPLLPLAKRFGVTTGYTDFNNELGQSTMAFDANGRHIDTAAYTRGGKAWRGAMAYLHASILLDPLPEEVESLADLYKVGLPGIDTNEMNLDEQKGYRYASHIRPQYEEASDLDKISWRVGKQYVKLPGGDLLVYGGGYKKIVHGLAEGLDIQTAVEVSHIRHDETGVTLTSSAGEMQCHQVIVTVPLAVLQAGVISFDPPLPAAKQTAIGRIGMGNYEKIALRFPHIFWPLEPHRLNYLSEGKPELYNAWLNNAHYSGQPILIAYHAGSRAQYINKLDDEELIDGCMNVLRKMFGPAIPNPSGYVRSSWEADPYSRGSYTYSKVGSEIEDRTTLAESVNGRLFFAGEATHPHFFGTVHGAYETGIRAAREVMKIR